ncbi:hypothetical protein C0992_004269 [Termitomyces sp. T32_za158]|nr:hypothetical protein C0992_004269 [Termitomyces sp. T32_za158]
MSSLNILSSIFRKDSKTTNGSANGSTREKVSGGGVQAIRDFREQVKKGHLLSMDMSTLASVVDFIRNKEAIDDRKFFLEHGLTFISRLEPGKFQTAVQNKIVELCTPYARSVQQSHPLPRNKLPDAGLVFDTLLRREGFVKHPAGLSSLMFSFAALVIHSVFRTSHHDWNINETSSYVDLSPLYGHDQAAQDRVRVRNGYGTLKPDVFAEDRLLLLPPAYIVRKLYEINERGTFVDPAKLKTDNPEDLKKLLEQEEELFQTARLEIRNDDHSVFERGKGNVCSVEFNCLYRWHATTSAEDERWVGQVIHQIFGGKSPDAVTVEDFKHAAHRLAAIQPDVSDWTFGGYVRGCFIVCYAYQVMPRLKRQEDHKFSDDDLANILHNASGIPCSGNTRQVRPSVDVLLDADLPKIACMRLNEVMGIEQNRRWGVCSLNDFRKYLGLKPYKTFLEWNSDKEIAGAAEKLYGSVENLELYVGLQAEEAKPVMEGAGLCPGYTISRAILSDAIALTRGDRHFTHDYTPYNLTAWGFADCQRDPNAFGFGSTLGRLLLRTLPHNFTENSTYTFFPLMTPESMETNLKNLKLLDQYDLSRPKKQNAAQVVSSYSEVAEIVKDRSATSSLYAARAARVLSNKGFYTVDGLEAQEKVYKALADNADSINKIGRFFYDTTRKLIDSNSYKLVGKITHGVDIVRDVLKYVPVYWAASEVGGFSLKTKESPEGHYTPQELYQILGDIYSFIFLDIEASKVMVLGAKVTTDIKHLLALIKGNLGLGMIDKNALSELFHKHKKTEHNEIVKRLHALGGSTDELANTILALLVGSTVELSLALTNIMNLYLGSEHQATILTADINDSKALNGLIYEALRLDPPFQGVYRTITKDSPIGSLSLKKGDKVFLDVKAANLDETVFSSANAVNSTRMGKNVIWGDGAFNHLGEPLTLKVLSEVIRAIFSYDNVRRAPGQSGILARSLMIVMP